MAGNLANLFSDATRTIGFGTAFWGKRVTFDRQPIHFSGMALRIPAEGEYIRLLGRHALPMSFTKGTSGSSWPPATGRLRLSLWAPYPPIV